MTPLPTPPRERPDVVDWVGEHLTGLFAGRVEASPSFFGGQTSAEESLARFSVEGYAAHRNEVWPVGRRGASRLSPYIRHGLLPLSRVWEAIAGGPARDVRKFRDELLWQEYSRHVYARLGSANRRGLRHELAGRGEADHPWPESMACVASNVEELERDGWLVNQTRMWLASQWAVRGGADWRDGEDRFFTHLLDGSRAANRLGWQWTVGTGTGRPYGFSRWQVEKRAPGLCRACELNLACPIQEWPPNPPLEAVEPHPRLRRDPDPDLTAGPSMVVERGKPEAVWITAESLGDDDPALVANPDVPAIFVFDEPLLRGLQLSAKRLVFLAETMADLGSRRPVEVHRGNPITVLTDHEVAVTYTPVPGWRTRANRIQPAEVHPWPWLRQPHGGPVTSFSGWRKALG